MKYKKISLLLSQLLLVSTISYAQTPCQDKDFWQTWYDKNQFKGFGLVPEKKEITKAQYNFAENYFSGKTLTKDYTRGIDLFQRAANSGLHQANFRLGLINHYGKGKVRDLKEAYRHYQKAAQNNSPEAQFNLGLMYRYGFGTSKNINGAFNWFIKS